MRKKNALAAAFALYSLAFMAQVQAQSVARQNAPPGAHEKLAEQVIGEQLVSYLHATSAGKNPEINLYHGSVC